MTILLEDSVCKDCKWTISCMVFKKINGIVDNRTFVDNSNHINDIIEKIVKKCSLQNIDRSYRIGKENNRRYILE